MSSSNPRSGNAKRMAPPAEASETVLLRSICGDAAISRLSAEHRAEMPETVMMLVGHLTTDQRSAVVRRYGLDGEGSIVDVPVLAVKLGRIPRQVHWSLASAERRLKEGLEENFPELIVPSRKPRDY